MNNYATKENNSKKILFACFPGDGHFNPLTGLAAHLSGIGYDVRWYTSKSYAPKLEKLRIPLYPFVKALDIADGDVDAIFPERAKLSSTISKLNFDITNVFIKRGPEYFEDIQNIYKEFPFRLMIADCAFTGIPFVKDLMRIPVIAVGVFPLTETSKDLPPAGLGMEPSYTFFGKLRQSLIRSIAQNILFRKPNRALHEMLNAHHISHNGEFVFDILAKKANLLLQSGTPGFEYQRSDLNRNVRFIGALLPHSAAKNTHTWFDEKLNRYEKIILVTQGTVEKDVHKLLVPTLEAYKNSKVLVVCTTGGSQTAFLKEKYPQPNFIIEDFIPFADVMPYADVYITNGGYGGVMLGIQNELPLVVAGVHEGKNEICARVGYFKLGINLKTETPLPGQIKGAVDQLLVDDSYKKNVKKLATEFLQYNPAALCEQYVRETLPHSYTFQSLVRDKAN
jgi:UDP:flavonoid glycosyltransferase YjiC (YdhE family)